MFGPFRLPHGGFACRFFSHIFSVCPLFRFRFIATRLNTTIIITTKITISVVHNYAIINDIATITVFSLCYLHTCRGTSKHSRAPYDYALFGASSRFECPLNERGSDTSGSSRQCRYEHVFLDFFSLPVYISSRKLVQIKHFGVTDCYQQPEEFNRCITIMYFFTRAKKIVLTNGYRNKRRQKKNQKSYIRLQTKETEDVFVETCDND